MADTASPLGLGCVNLGSLGGRKGARLVHRALDLGVRFIDTADAYGAGTSERVIGRALRGRREHAFVATKAGYVFRERVPLEIAARRVGAPLIRWARRRNRPGASRGPTRPAQRGYSHQDFSVRCLRTALEASLRRLGTDYVDLYQLHGPRGVGDDDVLALMLDLRAEGKIRGFGVGLETLDHAIDWLRTGALSGIQIPFGVLDPEAGDEVIPWAEAHGVPVIARGVFAGGFLTDRWDGNDALLRPGQPQLRAALRALASDAGVDALQIAAWFVSSRPGVTTVLVGTSSVRHLEQGLRYVEAPPPDDIMARVDALAGRGGASPSIDPVLREGGGA